MTNIKKIIKALLFFKPRYNSSEFISIKFPHNPNKRWKWLSYNICRVLLGLLDFYIVLLFAVTIAPHINFFLAMPLIGLLLLFLQKWNQYWGIE
ncbi:hypothetical protein OA509_02980 [Prochlorococcus sp. AH-716-I19]|nr:hypothetical protein [Prochlorococcus sp. AH-716-I19]